MNEENREKKYRMPIRKRCSGNLFIDFAFDLYIDSLFLLLPS